MKIKRHIYINNRGGFRSTVGQQDTHADEIRFLLEIDIPDKLFSRPDPVITVDIPDVFYDSDRTINAELFADDIGEQIEVAIADFDDGLRNKIGRYLAERINGAPVTDFED